eukprot:6649915-Prymnesium_polylepis.1
MPPLVFLTAGELAGTSICTLTRAVRVRGRCVGGTWAVRGRCVGGAWAVRGRCVGGVWAVRGRCVGDLVSPGG